MKTRFATFLSLALAASPASAQEARIVETASGPVRVETVASGLERPWGLALLPDGRILVTERPDRLRLVADGKLSAPLEGVPRVHPQGQGGLLDIALAPDFETSRTVYLSFAEPGPGGVAGAALARGRLDPSGTKLDGTTVIFRQEPKVSGDLHFGSRIVFGRDGNIFLALAERFRFDPAQDRGSHLGKIVRLEPDGSAPADNPFVGQADALPEIWSLGHRNIQAAALDPAGRLFVAEMGPKGGDELNLIEKGRNYGWPLVSHGVHYDGRPIPKPDTQAGFADALLQWTPVIAPSGMTFYTGDQFPLWRGSALIGGLQARGIVRVTLEGSAKEVERIPLGARIRDVRQGPDGAVYVATDAQKGAILRLTPAR